jgi:hypothetical protein
MLDTPVSVLLEHFEYVEYFRTMDTIVQLNKMG